MLKPFPSLSCITFVKIPLAKASWLPSSELVWEGLSEWTQEVMNKLGHIATVNNNMDKSLGKQTALWKTWNIEAEICWQMKYQEGHTCKKHFFILEPVGGTKRVLKVRKKCLNPFNNHLQMQSKKGWGKYCVPLSSLCSLWEIKHNKLHLDYFPKINKKRKDSSHLTSEKNLIICLNPL